MSRCKNTNFFSEIESFFKKDADNAIQAVINAVNLVYNFNGLYKTHRGTIAAIPHSNCNRHARGTTLPFANDFAPFNFIDCPIGV